MEKGLSITNYLSMDSMLLINNFNNYRITLNLLMNIGQTRPYINHIISENASFCITKIYAKRKEFFAVITAYYVYRTKGILIAMYYI